MKLLDKLIYRSKRPKHDSQETDSDDTEVYADRVTRAYSPVARKHRRRTSRDRHKPHSATLHEPRLSKLKPSRQTTSALADRYVVADQYSDTNCDSFTSLVPPIPSPGRASSKPTDSKKSSRPGFILVGIDFGTTFSGIAWAYSKQPDDISIITNWECVDSGNSDMSKTPTRIAYPKRSADDAQRASFDQSQSRVEWGYGIEDANAAEWFKLLLLEDSELEEDKRKSPQLQKAKTLLREAGKTPVQVVADYMRLLWQHTLFNLKRSLGEAMVEGLAFQVVCTVPAVWSTAAVSKMRTAAFDAGITTERFAGATTLEFVSEPEAAALATFEDLKARPNIQEGDIFVVCDAGGGTVDLISYKVRSTDPLQLDECVEGSGKLCGAVFLDDDFEKMIAQQLGDAWDVPESVKREFLDASWEKGIKRAFEDQDKRWKLNLPFPCTMRGASPTIILGREIIKDTFEHVVSQIRSLVNDQISAVEEKERKPPKGIILVGGFGSCRYLFNVLQRENRHRGIEVLQSSGNKPWTSICRGAVLRALTNSTLRKTVVQSRILRCNYGISFETSFDARVHSEDDRYYNFKEGKDFARNQLAWYLKRGSNMSGTKPVRHAWSNPVHCSVPRNTHDFDTVIYTCRARDPPSRLTDDIDASCRLKSDSPVNISNIRTIIGADGKEYKDVPYDLEMKVIGTAVEFAIIYDNKFVGRSQLAAETEDSVLSTQMDRLSLSPPHAKIRRSSKKWNAVALYDYSDDDDGNHSFEAGDKLKITGSLPDRGWVLAEKDGATKPVPSRYIAPA